MTDFDRWCAAGYPNEFESMFAVDILSLETGIGATGDEEGAYFHLHTLLTIIERSTFPAAVDEYPEGLLTLLLYWMDDRGWLEYGVSISHPWLTERGTALLHALSLRSTFTDPYAAGG